MRNYRGSTGAAWLPGVLLGLLALIIALTGSAYAAGQINGAEIAEHSLPADRLVNHSITSTQLAPLNFQPLHLVHFWHSAQALHDTGNPMVAKDDQGIVHLAGSMWKHQSTYWAFVLPVGDRPSHLLVIQVAGNFGNQALLLIHPNGRAYIQSSAEGNGVWWSLAGVSFPAGQ